MNADQDTAPGTTCDAPLDPELDRLFEEFMRSRDALRRRFGYDHPEPEQATPQTPSAARTST